MGAGHGEAEIWKRKLIRTRGVLYGWIALNLAAAACAVYLVFGESADRAGSAAETMPDLNSLAAFEVTAGKVDVERVLNRYLQQYAEEEAHGLSYAVELDDTLQLHGDIELIGHIVRLEVELEPEVTEHGGLLLTQKRFKAGGLPLPSTLVLGYVRQSFHFPDWIQIDPSRRQIHATTTAMQTGSGMRIRVREFDLAADKLRFDILLPAAQRD